MTERLQVPQELLSSFNNVISDSSSINWVLYTYDKGTSVLRLAGEGDGGLQELQEEFEDSKIQYAFARVIEPNSQLSKLVFISWCGEGVPSTKKGLYNFHVQDIQNYFKGFHVHINARQDGDVEPSVIMKKVRDSSGAKYTSSASNLSEKPSLPIQSKQPSKQDVLGYAPQPGQFASTQATPKPVFSRQASVKETPNPPPAPRAPSFSSNVPSQPPPSQVPVISTFRDQPQIVESVKSPQSPYQPPSAIKPRAPSNDYTSSQSDRERRKKEEEDRLVKERLAMMEMERELRRAEKEQKEIKNRFEKQAAETERRMSQQREQEERERQQREREAAEANRRMSQQREQQERERKQRETRELEERMKEEESKRLKQQEEKMQAQVTNASQTSHVIALYDYEPQEDNEIALQEGQKVVEVVQVDEGWWSGRNHHGQTGLFPANYVEVPAGVSIPHATQEPVRFPQRGRSPSPVRAVPSPQPVAQDNGKTAIALYSYDATEENELSLVEGDVITQIQFVSDDWWSGIVNGREGLFPGNYVQLEN